MLKGIKMAQDYIFKGIKLGYNIVYTKMKALAAQGVLKLFIAAYERPWTGISFVVHKEAQRIGKQMTDNWLNMNRILHCARCLSMQEMHKTIVEVDGRPVYLCKKCFASGTECGAVRPKLDLVKP